MEEMYVPEQTDRLIAVLIITTEEIVKDLQRGDRIINPFETGPEYAIQDRQTTNKPCLRHIPGNRIDGMVAEIQTTPDTTDQIREIVLLHPDREAEALLLTAVREDLPVLLLPRVEHLPCGAVRVHPEVRPRVVQEEEGEGKSIPLRK